MVSRYPPVCGEIIYDTYLPSTYQGTHHGYGWRPWRGTQPIGDLGANFDKIRSLGLKFALATNNAGYSTDQS